MNAIDSFLNKITMYRLVRNGLILLAALTIVFAFVGWLPYTGFQLTVSIVALLISCIAANGLGVIFTKASPTQESTIITALILYFILGPVQSPGDVILLVVGGVIAMLSKYVLVWKRKHIFNPAAFSAFVLSVAGTSIASWWVATPILLPFVLVLGLLIVRKIKRFDLFWTFVITATVVFVTRSVFENTAPLMALRELYLSFPLIFFATIMLVEPQTMPMGKSDRLIFGGIVGVLFSISFAFGNLTSTPEFALLIGNLYALITTFGTRMLLTFNGTKQLSREVYEYSFVPNIPVHFLPGQYLEWTISHKKADQRGVRRYFTIASAPSDPFIRLGVRMPVERSTFKDQLVNIKKGEVISVANVSGAFTLPKNPDIPIACIAGGIGITPFMSMFRELAARRERRDVVLIYSAQSPLDFAYREEIEAMKDSIGLSVLYLPTSFTEHTNWEGPSGYLTNDLVKQYIPDFQNRIWYLSGPEGMVRNYSWLVRKMGVPRHAIKHDYFPGF